MIVWRINRQLPVPVVTCQLHDTVRPYCFGFPLPKRSATTLDGHPTQRVVSQHRAVE